MPVIIPSDQSNLFSRLSKSGAVVLSEEQALAQDIRPARIGLLNLMPAPAMESTENQWIRYISNTVLQVELVFLKFDNDIRERQGGSRREILKRYTSFSQGTQDGLDALIVTGDNLEIKKDISPPEELPFKEIRYGSALAEIIDWSRKNVYSTIYSCLAAHFALNHLFNIPRTIASEKVFGVYEHQMTRFLRSPITQGMDDIVTAPHSRWGIMDSQDLANAGVQVLANNDDVGWLVATSENAKGGLDIFMQGHPEYDKYDLHSEFLRDWEKGRGVPSGYYNNNNPASLPRMTWANDARAFHANWMSSIYKHFSGDFA